jgi:hypothetical protein
LLGTLVRDQMPVDVAPAPSGFENRTLAAHRIGVMADVQPKAKANRRATVYVCRGMTCSLPIVDPAGLGKVLAHA